jgi:sugar phosphate isomerase/epimerase
MRADQLGVQLHCLRHAVREDLPRTFANIRQLGLETVELVSFPGCRGNPWGDFGIAADLPARCVRAALELAGLRCPSVMVNEQELAAERVDAVLDWIAGTGAGSVALTAFAVPQSATVGDWRVMLARTHAHRERCRARGLEFVLHTQPELWKPVESRRPIELLLAEVDPALTALEYDPSGAVMHGRDALSLFSEWRGRFHAVHLRDARPPAKPVPYLPALPLGQGVIDWAQFVDASCNASVRWYFLEMEVVDPAETMGALSASLAHLASLGLPARANAEFVGSSRAAGIA